MPSHRGKRSQKGKENQQTRYLTYEEKTAQKDTIRGIIKDNCRRDNVTGEIAYNPKDKANIESALVGEQFRVEKQVAQGSVYEKHLKVKTEKIWNPINQDLANSVLAGLEAGEVLNRAVVPRWW
jgi:hypothetical protein